MENQPRHFAAGGERTFYNQPAARVLGGHINGHRATQRVAVEDDILRHETARLDKVFIRRLAVAIDARLVRRPFALSVAAVIKSQDVDSKPREGLHLLQAHPDVLRVAVKPQEDLRTRRRREKPGVKLRAVPSLNPNFYRREAVNFG